MGFRSKLLLKLEAKGLSGDEVIMQLTPNEYEKMSQKIDDYRLCIVINALNIDKRSLFIYSYNHYTGKWTNEEKPEKILELQERRHISAIARTKIIKNMSTLIFIIDDDEV